MIDSELLLFTMISNMIIFMIVVMIKSTIIIMKVVVGSFELISIKKRY